MTDDEIKQGLAQLADDKKLSEFSRSSSIPYRTLMGAIHPNKSRWTGEQVQMTATTRKLISEALSKWNKQKGKK